MMTASRKEINQKFRYWKFRVFKGMAAIGILAGGVNLIISANAAIAENVPEIVYIDIAVYLLWVFNALVPYAPIKFRYFVFLFLLYSLGVVLLLLAGPFAGGLNWLFVFSVLAAVFFHRNAIFIALAINAFTVAVLYGMFYFPEVLPPALESYSMEGFAAVGMNFLMINAAVVFPTGLMLKWLQETLQREALANEQLQEKQRNLAEALERAEESDRLKTAFLQNISHEIRTPMNAISSFARLLTPDLDPETQQSYKALIVKSTNQLLRLIDNVVELSRLQTDPHPLNYQHFDARAVIQEVYREWQFQIPQHLDFQLRINPSGTQIQVMGNQHALMQVLDNLLDNALKFTSSGTIELGLLSINKNRVLCYVSDSGTGINADEQKQVFEKFYKSPTGQNNFTRGTGIGLTLVQQLVKLMQGEIWIKSKENKGTVVYFTLYRSTG